MATPITQVFGHPLVAATPDDVNSRWTNLFGIEMELENLSDTDDFSYWHGHEDASLRNGWEYTLSQPLTGNRLAEAIAAFYNRGMSWEAGARTSTHIHINMTDTTIEHVRAMVFVMYIIEDALFNVVGEGRKWSGYAMPLYHMEPARLRGMFQTTARHEILNMLAPMRNAERYYGLNTAALRRFGTLEFRHFPGGPTQEELSSWIDLIETLKIRTATLDVNAFAGTVIDEDQLLRMLEYYVPSAWWPRLLAHSSPEGLMERYQEICALVEGADAPTRIEQLVFINDMLVNFVCRRILTNDTQREYFRNTIRQFTVVASSEWAHYVLQAQRMSEAPTQSPPAPEEDPFASNSPTVTLEELRRLTEAPVTGPRTVPRRTARPPQFFYNEFGPPPPEMAAAQDGFNELTASTRWAHPMRSSLLDDDDE